MSRRMPRTARFSRKEPPLRTNWTLSMGWTIRGLRTQESGHFNARAFWQEFWRVFARPARILPKISGIPPYIAAPAPCSPQGGTLPPVGPRPSVNERSFIFAPGPSVCSVNERSFIFALGRLNERSFISRPPPRPYKVMGLLEPFDRAARGPGCFTKQNVRKGVDGCPRRAQGRLVPSKQPPGTGVAP